MSSSHLDRFSMPTARLRALITLYHDTKTMVTAENLSAQIDAEFLNNHGKTSTFADFYDYRKLSDAVADKQKGKPASLIIRGVTVNVEPSRTWSDQTSEREAQIKGALWGTQIDGKAGLETILETIESAEREERLINQTATDSQYKANQ